MIFGPWMNNQNEIDFIEDDVSVITNGIVKHTQWDLIASGVVKKIVSIVSKDKKYATIFPNLTYYFTISRHSSMMLQVIKGKLKKENFQKIKLFLL